MIVAHMETTKATKLALQFWSFVPFAVLEGIGPGPVLLGPDPIAAVATRVGPGHTQIILYRALLPGCVTCPLALIGPASAGVGRDRGALAQAHGLASDGVGGAAGGILRAGARRAGEGGGAGPVGIRRRCRDS